MPPLIQSGATVKAGGSGPRRALGLFGDVQRGEQRHALEYSIRRSGGAGHGYRRHAGKYMITAGVHAGMLNRLAIIVLLIVRGVFMRLRCGAMMMLMMTGYYLRDVS